MEKHEDDTEQARCISSTKLEKDHWNHMERQGIKRRSTSTYWTETTAGHRRGKEIPVCGSRRADGTRTPSPPQLSGHQLTAERTEVDQRRLGDQHSERIYRQEESAKC